MREFGKNVKAARIVLKMSAANLSRKVGCSRQYISQIEAGANPSLVFALAIGEALGKNVYDLAERKPPAK